MGSRGVKSASNSYLTGAEADAVEAYVSGESMFVNNALRGVNDITLTAEEMGQVKTLDKVLNQKVSGTLYRSVDAEAIFGKMSDVAFDNLKSEILYSEFSKAKGEYSQNIAKQVNSTLSKTQGKTFTDKGFVSTSKSEQIANSWGDFTGSSKPIVAKITTGSHTKGRDVSKATKNIANSEKADPQKEVLLARNQQYQITDIYGKNGNIYVDLKMK